MAERKMLGSWLPDDWSAADPFREKFHATGKVKTMWHSLGLYHYNTSRSTTWYEHLGFTTHSTYFLRWRISWCSEIFKSYSPEGDGPVSSLFIGGISHQTQPNLVVGFNLPLWKMMDWVTVGMMTFPIWWESHKKWSKPPANHMFSWLYRSTSHEISTNPGWWFNPHHEISMSPPSGQSATDNMAPSSAKSSVDLRFSTSHPPLG